MDLLLTAKYNSKEHRKNSYAKVTGEKTVSGFPFESVWPPLCWYLLLSPKGASGALPVSEWHCHSPISANPKAKQQACLSLSISLSTSLLPLQSWVQSIIKFYNHHYIHHLAHGSNLLEDLLNGESYSYLTDGESDSPLSHNLTPHLYPPRPSNPSNVVYSLSPAFSSSVSQIVSPCFFIILSLHKLFLPPVELRVLLLLLLQFPPASIHPSSWVF